MREPKWKTIMQFVIVLPWPKKLRQPRARGTERDLSSMHAPMCGVPVSIFLARVVLYIRVHDMLVEFFAGT